MTSAYHNANATVSAHGAAALTKSDATIFPVCRAIYVGGTGDVAVTMADGQTSIIFSAVPVGVFPIQITQLLSTGTTATNIIALY
jgi:hypothetical protein